MTDVTNGIKSVADLAATLDTARASLESARAEVARADRLFKSATAAEKAAYKAFNDAVNAMRPKRGTRQAKIAEQSPPAAS